MSCSLHGQDEILHDKQQDISQKSCIPAINIAMGHQATASLRMLLTLLHPHSFSILLSEATTSFKEKNAGKSREKNAT